MNADDFDWRTQTTLKGTVSRIGQWVRGTCATCGRGPDVLLYDDYDDPTLICSDCSHKRAVAMGPRKEQCDECGERPAYRDPVSGKNEFYCIKCHAKHGTVFQNRWAGAEARTGRVLGIHDKAKCDAAGYGTDCKGEVKPRGGDMKGRLLCNKHAGRVSSGPEWHQ